MSELNFDECYAFAIDLVKIAGKMVKEAISKQKSIEMKSSSRDLVTETDKAVEELLLSKLAEKFPSHKFIGEESIAAGIKTTLTDAPTWIIDPVDGTMNFVHSFPYTCISVGFWVNKDPEIGIVFNPILDQLYTARKSQGAYLNGERIHVSSQKDLSKSLIFTEMGTRQDPEKMEILLRNFRRIVKECHGIRSMGSCALNICHVATGGVEAYYEIGVHAWDTAAGSLIVQEAGGVAVDVNGEPFNVLNRRILCAANKEIADELVKLLEIYEEEWD